MILTIAVKHTDGRRFVYLEANHHAFTAAALMGNRDGSMDPIFRESMEGLRSRGVESLSVEADGRVFFQVFV